MTAFLTGSHEFKYATSKSDVDLVILVDEVTKEKLIDLSDTGKLPIKFGKLNLIAATTPEEYAFWMMAKRVCIKTEIKDKATAKCMHDELRDQFRMPDYDHESEPKELIEPECEGY